MQYKNIDCKMKEIYFNIKPVEVEPERTKTFWQTMNMIGSNNLTLQRIKAA